MTSAQARRWRRSDVETLIFYKLGINQNHYTFALILPIKTVMCSKFPETKFTDYEFSIWDLSLSLSQSVRAHLGNSQLEWLVRHIRGELCRFPRVYQYLTKRTPACRIEKKLLRETRLLVSEDRDYVTDLKKETISCWHVGCAYGPRRARIWGSWIVVSLNSRLESNREEEEEVVGQW